VFVSCGASLAALLDGGQLMRFLLLVLLLALTPLVAGCEAIEGIFKAGFYVGVLVVVLIIAGVGFLVMKMR
jgi:hypothetical protein